MSVWTILAHVQRVAFGLPGTPLVPSKGAVEHSRGCTHAEPRLTAVVAKWASAACCPLLEQRGIYHVATGGILANKVTRVLPGAIRHQRTPHFPCSGADYLSVVTADLAVLAIGRFVSAVTVVIIALFVVPILYSLFHIHVLASAHPKVLSVLLAATIS